MGLAAVRRVGLRRCACGCGELESPAGGFAGVAGQCRVQLRTAQLLEADVVAASGVCIAVGTGRRGDEVLV